MTYIFIYRYIKNNNKLGILNRFSKQKLSPPLRLKLNVKFPTFLSHGNT